MVGGIFWDLLGPINTYPDIFESASFSFRARLSVHTQPANPDIFDPPIRGENNKSATNPITCGRGNF